MKTLATLFASLLIAGCTTAIPQKTKNNAKYLEVTTIELPAKLYDAFEKHNYSVITTKGKISEAVIIIADIPSTIVRKQHAELLKELTTPQDIIFVEGAKGKQYSDLEQQLFDEFKFPQQIREKIKAEAQKQTPTNTNKYLNQTIDCEILSSDEPVLQYVSTALLLPDIEKMPPEDIPELEQVRERAIHYNNLAKIKTYEENKKPNTQCYQIIHFDKTLSKKKIMQLNDGHLRGIYVPDNAGQFWITIEESEIPYMIITPKNIMQELYKLLENPELETK